MIRVALDAMGGDGAPALEVDGAALALRDLPADFTLTLVGRADEIAQHLARYPELDTTRITIVDTPDVIGMAEKPLAAVRKKPRSSLVVGTRLQLDGDVDAFVSAGNTGAILAASTIMLGLIDGVDRATVASLFPTLAGNTLVLDAGANLDCSARELVSFARLGSVYMRDAFGVANPKVGLLNVGEEEEKGNATLRETYLALTSATRLNFIGNVEGRDIVVPNPRFGRVDVVVCDGFVGNALLKFYESIGDLVNEVLGRHASELLTSEVIKPLIRFLDPSSYGGAALLGVRGVVVIGHGASTAESFMHAIEKAVAAVRGGLRGHIEAELSLQTAQAGA